MSYKRLRGLLLGLTVPRFEGGEREKKLDLGWSGTADPWGRGPVPDHSPPSLSSQIQ